MESVSPCQSVFHVSTLGLISFPRDDHLVAVFVPSLGILLSRSVVSDSLRPHELQHARLPCPSLSPGACSDSCPLSRWCHPTVSSSVFPVSSHLQSFPASRSFPMSQLFISGGQSTGASDSASFLPKNVQVCLSPEEASISLLPFSFYLQSFPASRSFPMSQLFT